MTTAVILAGGQGTRLRSAVPDLPKPMAAVRGRPFLEHQMDYWIAQGIDRFVLSVGYRHQAIISHFGTEYRGTPLFYAVEDVPLGTGGGLLLASRGLTEPFVVLNGDTFFEVNLDALLEFHRSRKSHWTFALFRSVEAGRYMGMDVAEDGRIISLKSDAPLSKLLANGGVYIVDPNMLHALSWVPGTSVSLEDELLPAAAGTGKHLFGLEFPGKFIDIGIPNDYFRASEILP